MPFVSLSRDQYFRRIYKNSQCRTNICGCTMQLTFMYNIVLLYMLIFLVADCVCGVVGTSFLVVVGQHEDSWVGSILHHIQVGPRRVIRRPMWRTLRTTRSQLPESRRTLSPLVISRLYMICNPRPPVCYRSLGASSSIVYTHTHNAWYSRVLYTHPYH